MKEKQLQIEFVTKHRQSITYVHLMDKIMEAEYTDDSRCQWQYPLSARKEMAFFLPQQANANSLYWRIQAERRKCKLKHMNGYDTSLHPAIFSLSSGLEEVPNHQRSSLQDDLTSDDFWLWIVDENPNNSVVWFMISLELSQLENTTLIGRHSIYISYMCIYFYNDEWPIPIIFILSNIFQKSTFFLEKKPKITVVPKN